jgi:transcriptional regulator with XRE-family HTH domain
MPGPVARTKLANLRLESGIAQEELAAATGLSIATYRRLERGEMPNPPLRYLVNCARALGVDVADVVEEEWNDSYPLSPRAKKPPASGWLDRDRP